MNNEVFLDILPRKKGTGKTYNQQVIDWVHSIGYKVKGVYNEIEFEVEIIDYKDRFLYIKYMNNEIFKINCDSFKKCYLGNLLGTRTPRFKVETGTIFKNERRNITITDREYRDNPNNKGKFLKWYKYTCNVCYWTEGWIEEYNLLKENGCSCCCNRTTVLGINSIWDTDKWMIPIVGEEFSKTHTHSCADYIYPICPDCGRIKDKKNRIYDIYIIHSIRCSCSDKTSYPEKVMFSVFEQLGLKFKTQLTKTAFKWIKNYRYDFYFELNNEQYICEVNGIQHYEKSNRKGARALKEEQENDRIKKQLALANGIKSENYIVIDCRESNLEFIKQNILDNKTLNELFDLNKINWIKCGEYACSNLVKKACELKKNNPNLTTIKIGIIMGYHYATIIKWLKQGDELKWCTYNAKQEQIKASKNYALKYFNPIICLNTGDIFKSTMECDRQSEKILGKKFTFSGICRCANNILKTYKGFIFKYIKNLTKEEWIEYDIENKLKHFNFSRDQEIEIVDEVENNKLE